MSTPSANELGSDGPGGLIGLEYLEPEGDAVRARIEATDSVRQPHGIVHGGVYSVMAESICSAHTAMAVAGEGMIAMGQSNSATFMRPISWGHVNATA